MARREYIPKSSVSKGVLKKKILAAMIECAEDIHGFIKVAAGLVFESDYICPEEFKPGVADKFLFSKIIDADWDRVLDIYCCTPLCARMIGFGLMVEAYYPQYGTFKK